MDSDDIMFPNRLITQLEFMRNTPDCVLCGSQILMFRENTNNIISLTKHPNYTWEEFKSMENKPHWLMNHPTFCFRKSKTSRMDFSKFDCMEEKNVGCAL